MISENQFAIYGSYGVTMTGIYADYYNLAGSYAEGNAYGIAEAYGYLGSGEYYSYSFAANMSVAGPGEGFAQTAYGFEWFLTLTNENPTGGLAYFTVYSSLLEGNGATAGGNAIAYGGIVEIGGSYFLGYNTVTLNGNGIASDYAHNWNVDYQDYTPGYALTGSYGGFTDTLSFGQSVVIGIWASGNTNATSTGSSVPAPAAIAPFALGLIPALRRRNKS
jgi:MYXO-CTERM domain-containing protein